MEQTPKTLLAVAGYWPSRNPNHHLGALSRANVVATGNALDQEFDDARFSIGQVNFSIPRLQGQDMRDLTIDLFPDIDSTRLSAGLKRNVTNTVREYLEIFRFLSQHPEYSSVVHLLNPTHIDRAKLLHDLVLPTRALLGLNSVSYDFQVTSDFLSVSQAAVLSSCAEQGLFNKREEKAMFLAKRPNILKVIDSLPDFAKRLGEDFAIRNLL